MHVVRIEKVQSGTLVNGVRVVNEGLIWCENGKRLVQIEL